MWTGVGGMPPIANHRIFWSGGRISIFIHIHISLKAIKGLPWAKMGCLQSASPLAWNEFVLDYENINISQEALNTILYGFKIDPWLVVYWLQKKHDKTYRHFPQRFTHNGKLI